MDFDSWELVTLYIVTMLNMNQQQKQLTLSRTFPEPSCLEVLLRPQLHVLFLRVDMGMHPALGAKCLPFPYFATILDVYWTEGTI